MVEIRKPTVYEWTALALLAVFLLLCAVWSVRRTPSSPVWTVQTERFDSPSADTSSPDGRPDGLLEGEIINLNTATRSDLMRLPNVGAVRADAMLAYRDEHGSFQSVDDLLNVPGIGPGTLDPLRPFLTVR